MPIIVTSKDDLYEEVVLRNNFWQFDFIYASVDLALSCKDEKSSFITLSFIKSLNHLATLNLVSEPGEIRKDDVYIQGSDHEPPSPMDAKTLFIDFFPKLHNEWDKFDPIDLAAFILWKINWIHPFEEGNGRTARAAMYYALCIKLGLWLPGKNLILEFMRGDSKYYELLRMTDKSHEENNLNLSPLSEYIAELLEKQLDSTNDS